MLITSDFSEYLDCFDMPCCLFVGSVPQNIDLGLLKSIMYEIDPKSSYFFADDKSAHYNSFSAYKSGNKSLSDDELFIKYFIKTYEQYLFRFVLNNSLTYKVELIDALNVAQSTILLNRHKISIRKGKIPFELAKEIKHDILDSCILFPPIPMDKTRFISIINLLRFAYKKFPDLKYGQLSVEDMQKIHDSYYRCSYADISLLNDYLAQMVCLSDWNPSIEFAKSENDDLLQNMKKDDHNVLNVDSTEFTSDYEEDIDDSINNPLPPEIWQHRLEFMDNVLFNNRQQQLIDCGYTVDVEPVERYYAYESEDAILSHELTNIICDVFDTLTPREVEILRLRFGFKDGETHTLEEVANEFHVTRERVRQIEAKALRKLRHPSRTKKLKDYTDLSVNTTHLCEIQKLNKSLESYTEYGCREGINSIIVKYSSLSHDPDIYFRSLFIKVIGNYFSSYKASLLKDYTGISSQALSKSIVTEKYARSEPYLEQCVAEAITVFHRNKHEFTVLSEYEAAKADYIQQYHCGFSFQNTTQTLW